MAAQDDSQDDANGGIEDESVGGCEQRRKLVEKHKLIIVMVGLPGRGKTFLCNKLCSYLNWCGLAAPLDPPTEAPVKRLAAEGPQSRAQAWAPHPPLQCGLLPPPHEHKPRGPGCHVL